MYEETTITKNTKYFSPEQRTSNVEPQPVIEQDSNTNIDKHDVPWWMSPEFSWWWTGVFVPIIIAIITNRQVKKARIKRKLAEENGIIIKKKKLFNFFSKK